MSTRTTDKLTAKEHKVISIIKEDPTLSLREIALKTGTSHETVRYNILCLRAKGFLKPAEEKIFWELTEKEIPPFKNESLPVESAGASPEDATPND